MGNKKGKKDALIKGEVGKRLEKEAIVFEIGDGMII